ncbi:hypothetical protein A6g_04930 [Bacillus velezensis]|nr:hypothetical protein A6g_04930 [Bacillus velezensis]
MDFFVGTMMMQRILTLKRKSIAGDLFTKPYSIRPLQQCRDELGWHRDMTRPQDKYLGGEFFYCFTKK